jgi:hypothetical protein
MAEFDVVQVRLAHRRAIVFQYPPATALSVKPQSFCVPRRALPRKFSFTGCNCILSQFLSLAAFGICGNSLLAFRRSRLSTTGADKRGL